MNLTKFLKITYVLIFPEFFISNKVYLQSIILK
jgi:hypothetical protein